MTDYRAMWRPYQVTDVSTLEEFMARYYKPGRYLGQDPVIAAAMLVSHRADLERYGVDWISHHDSVTGRVVSFYLPK